MPNKALKVGLTAGMLTAALAGLLWTTMADGAQYYMHVDEVMVEPEAWAGKRLQVHGYAAKIARAKSSLDWRFDIENNGHVVHAEYNGVVPDTFQNESEIVVSGRLEGHRLLVEPNGIMAKCPSKYEAKPSLGEAVTGSESSRETDGTSN